MRDETLRMEQVTFVEQGVTELNHFSLNVLAGEIMGLIPVNSNGLDALIRLLRQNLPIHYGYIYYRNRLVNRWQHSDGTENRIGVITGQSGLADDLTVADNVFVLRHGFKMRVIRREVLNREMSRVLLDIGANISPAAYARELTAFERFVVEIVKAVVAGAKLVILMDAGTIVSETELNRLHEILRHYAAQGVSFLYVSQHYEEIRQSCNRVALMSNGRITTVLSARDTAPECIRRFAASAYERLVREQDGRRLPVHAQKPVLELSELCYGAIDGLNLCVAPGECVVIQDLNNHILDDLVEVLAGLKPPKSGRILVDGRPFTRARGREMAVIQQAATSTMLFPELSYLDNLCMTVDRRLPGVWMHSRQRRGIRGECEAMLGEDVFDKPVERLTQAQKYELIYARILLQRPKVAVCVQPFMQADVERRMQIWKLLEHFLEKGIAVVILAVNLADTLSLAERLIRVQDGRVLAAFERSEFGELPDTVPWQHLWSEGGKP